MDITDSKATIRHKCSRNTIAARGEGNSDEETDEMQEEDYEI